MQINNYSLSPISALQNDNAVNTVDKNSENNFLNALADVAGVKTENNIPTVYAGQSKEFEFYTKQEKVPSKAEKLRTIDDALAEIERIIRNIKNGK